MFSNTSSRREHSSSLSDVNRFQKRRDITGISSPGSQQGLISLFQTQERENEIKKKQTHLERDGLY